jgi:uncharacterized peroxidase-related enzyme
MSFIQTVDRGPVPNYERAFSLRPEAYAAWRGLVESITATMDPRRYELVSCAAARRLKSSYCLLAHGSRLLNDHLPAETVLALAADHHAAGLDEVDVAVMDLAEKVAADASAVTADDIDRLRAVGLDDAEILDVVLAASARCFFSKVLDGTGALPDHRFAQLDPALRDALTVGRPIARSDAEAR